MGVTDKDAPRGFMWPEGPKWGPTQRDALWMTAYLALCNMQIALSVGMAKTVFYGLLRSSYRSARGKLLYKVQIEHDKETTQGFQSDSCRLAF
jgi:hypothetical protein